MSDRPLFSPETVQAVKGLKIFIIPATLSLALAGGLLFFAGFTPSSAIAGQGVAVPLIVASDGHDISDQRPLIMTASAEASTEATPAQKSDLTASKVATPPVPRNAPGSARPISSKTASAKVASNKVTSGVARVQPGMIKVKPPKSQVPSTPAWVCGEHPFVVRTESGQQKLVNPTTLSPDTLDVQGIMNGSQNKAALVEGKLYRVGDRLGAQDLQWTVASIDDSSVTVQREHNNRVFAVTVYASGTGTITGGGTASNSGIR